MSPASILICCSSQASMDSQELENWLLGTVAQLGSQAASLYGVFEGVSADQEQRTVRQDRYEAGSIWFLAIFDEDALDSARLAELLAEMRLLGLRPTVFRPGSVRMAAQDLSVG